MVIDVMLVRIEERDSSFVFVYPLGNPPGCEGERVFGKYQTREAASDALATMKTIARLGYGNQLSLKNE